jgi:hypothetical protein
MVTNIDWDFNMKAFGWTVLHHVSYFRGVVDIQEAGLYLFSINNVASFKINNYAHVANVYGYPHATQSPIYLGLGQHWLYVALNMDIRLFGFSVPPNPYFSGSIFKINPDQNLVALTDDTMLPENLDGRLVSNWASVAVMNTQTGPHNASYKQVVDVITVDEQGNIIPNAVESFSVLKIVPGQVFPIPFQLKRDSAITSMRIAVRLLDSETFETSIVDFGLFLLKQRSWGDVLKLTFLGYDYSVQYSMIKPPSRICRGTGKCPILVAFHGPKIDADSVAWTSKISRQNYAWVLYPSGRSTQGFDWTGPSMQSLETCVEAS